MKKIPKKITKSINELLILVDQVFGEKAKRVILYGSYARGDFNRSSDIDVMILTDLNEDELIEYRDKLWDLAYDIELENNTSGIQIAKYIRENDWDSEIIFTTSHDKMFETVYRNIYQVFDFIEKYHDMSKRLEEDINIILRKNFDNKMLTYSNRLFDLKVYYRSILYIYREKDERKLVIVTDTNIFKIGLTIPEMLELLDERFKQCHRSCIVNVDRVQKFNWNNNSFLLDNKEEIPMLSKKFKKEVLGE